MIIPFHPKQPCDRYYYSHFFLENIEVIFSVTQLTRRRDSSDSRSSIHFYTQFCQELCDSTESLLSFMPLENLPLKAFQKEQMKEGKVGKKEGRMGGGREEEF